MPDDREYTPWGILRYLPSGKAPPVLRRSVLLLLSLFIAVGLAGCSSSVDPVQAAGAVVIDVRTPQEFAEGHLDGAVNIDVNSADFAARIRALDPGARYLVYCRSGNRSAQAVERMKAAGFTSVTDLGSKEAASTATGVAIVR